MPSITTAPPSRGADAAGIGGRGQPGLLAGKGQRPADPEAGGARQRHGEQLGDAMDQGQPPNGMSRPWVEKMARNAPSISPL